MFEYNPVLIYLFTLFVCLSILMKAFKDLCKDNEFESSSSDFHGARKCSYFHFVTMNSRSFKNDFLQEL